MGRHADLLARMDPDELVGRVQEEVSTLRGDLAAAREDRAVEAEFLALQGHLDGTSTL